MSKTQRTSDDVLDGWNEVKSLLDNIEPDFEGKSGIIDAVPYLKIQNQSKQLDFYFNKTILDQFSVDKLGEIYDLLVNIRNHIINRNTKISAIRVETTLELINKIQSEINKLFEIFKQNKFSVMFAELFEKLHQSFDKDREKFQHQVDEFLGKSYYKKLSSAFSEQVRLISASRKENLKRFNCFVYSITGVVFASYTMPYLDVSFLAFLKQGNDLVSFVKGIIIRFALISPLIWLAYFRLKNANEDKLLEQEYRHKETMAKSYVYYANEIDRLGWTDESFEEKEKLKSNLLNTSIQILGKDPTDLLNKNRTDDFPFEKVIMELIKKIPTKN